MYRDTSLMYELCTTLKENRYINHNSNEILTSSQEIRINQYIDDLTIDLFFRLNSLKKITISPESCFGCGLHYASSGVSKIKTQIELDLSNRYDRYTFLSLMTNKFFLKQKFKKNRFINNLMMVNVEFGSTGISDAIIKGFVTNLYIEPFLCEYRSVNWDYCRSAMLYCLRDFMHSWKMEIKYDIRADSRLFDSLKDYLKIKDQEIFPSITLEYALAIYTILLEKIQLYDDNIGPIVAFGLKNNTTDYTHPLVLFHNFELEVNRLFRREDIAYEDLYLRFINPESSRAFQIQYNSPSSDFVNIQLFDGEIIQDVLSFNTLPLPYFYNKKK